MSAAGPLEGVRVLVTRPEHQARRLCQLISERGGEAIPFATILIEDLSDTETVRQAVASLDSTDLAIFASANAVRYGLAAIRRAGALPRRLPVFAVGPATGAALASEGMEQVHVPAEGADSEALLDLPELRQVEGRSIAIFSGEGGRPTLRETLAQRGASVTVVPCYRRRPAKDIPEAVRQALARHRVHAVTLTSGEGLQNLYGVLDGELATGLRRLPHFVIHDRVALAARNAGAQEIIVAPGGDEALVEALVHWLSTAHASATLH